MTSVAIPFALAVTPICEVRTMIGSWNFKALHSVGQTDLTRVAIKNGKQKFGEQQTQESLTNRLYLKSGLPSITGHIGCTVCSWMG